MIIKVSSKNPQQLQTLLKPKTILQFAAIMSNLSSVIGIYCTKYGALKQHDSAEAWQILKIANRETRK